jgi:hypothetical protein
VGNRPDAPVRPSVEEIKAFASRYAELANAARHGDLSSARALYKTLASCQHAPRSVEQIENEIDDDRKADPNATDAGGRLRREWMTAELQRCIALGDRQLEALASWTALAADLGDAEARLLYPQVGIPLDRKDGHYMRDYRDYQERTDRYLQEEIDRGNTRALVAASYSYTMGQGHRPDPAKAYAYEYAYALASGSPSQVTANTLSVLRSKVPAGEVESATALGERIYSQCCSGGH